jgi:hypothetical protein
MPREIGGIGVVKRNGDVIKLAANMGNNAPGACDVTNATIYLKFPNPNGTEGEEIVVATGIDLPAGMPVTRIGDVVKRTVNFDDGVFRGFVYLGGRGRVHLGAGPHVESDLGTLGSPLVISRPLTTLDVTPAPSGGPPFTVTYTYTVENDSPSDPGMPVNPTPDVGSPTLNDDGCADVAFTGGDTVPEFPPTLTHGETWTYECERSFPAGSVVSIARFTGFSTRDGRPWPRNVVRTAFCGREPATIIGTENDDTLVGTPGDDVIVLRGGEDSVRAGRGNDIVCGGDGRDVIRGGEGDDILRGEGAADRLIGGLGTDTLIGGPGADSIEQ